MTPRAYLLAGFLFILLAMSGWAKAETIPSTVNTVDGPVLTRYRLGYVQCAATAPFSGQFSTALAACQCGVGVATNPTPTDVTAATGGVCYGHTTGSPSNPVGWGSYFSQQGCEEGDTFTVGSPNVCRRTTYSCPAGYAMSSDQLSCTRQDCSRGTKVDSGMYYDSNGDGITKHACIKGCWADFKGTGPSKYYDLASQELDNVYIGDYIADGSTCSTFTPIEGAPPQTPDPPTNTPEYDCASKGMTWGTLNGTTVCLAPGTPNAPPTNNPPETTQEKNNDDNSSKETTTQDTVSGDTVTRTTTTVTKDSSGNVTGTTSTTTSAPIGAFCEQNPNASVCAKSKVAGGGDCDTPPESSGDAIQAAILRQSWETRCEAHSINSKMEAAGTWGQEQIDAFSGEQNPLDSPTTKNIADLFDDTNLLGAHSCPAPRVLNTPLGTWELPYTEFCNLAVIVGHLILIFASFLSFRIVIGAL